MVVSNSNHNIAWVYVSVIHLPRQNVLQVISCVSLYILESIKENVGTLLPIHISAQHTTGIPAPKNWKFTIILAHWLTPHLKCITNFVCYFLFKSWKYNGISYFFPLVIPFNFTIQRRRLSSFCMNIFWTNGIYLLKTRTLCINVCFRVIESLYLYSLCSRSMTPTWIAK